MGLHAHVRIDLFQRAACTFDLGNTHVGRAVNHLSLQVRKIDRVMVDHAQRADSGRGQILQEGCAEAAGAETRLLGGEFLSQLPVFDPRPGESSEPQRALADAMRAADGVIIATPGYHGSMSGLVKNALDTLELTREDAAPYFQGRPVGVIVTADGWQVDPAITVKPTQGQIDDLIQRVADRAKKKERVLVTTLTKKMAEELTEYLSAKGGSASGGEEKKIKVTLIRSEITQPETQRRTLRGLGLTRLNRTKELKDTPAIRGMIRKVSHLVKVVEG